MNDLKPTPQRTIATMTLMASAAFAIFATPLGWAQSAQLPLAPRAKGQEQYATPGALDSRIVEFPYNQNGVFNVLTKVERFTRLSLGPTEFVRGFYLSDTIQWEFHVAADKRNVFVKPIQRGIATTATLLTNLREFDIDLRETSGAWHQRVSWAQEPTRQGKYFEEVSNFGQIPTGGMAGAKAPTPLTEALNQPCNPSAVGVRTIYTVKKSDAAFTPTHVWDDGKRYTCIKLPEGMQETPALFALDKEGKPEIVDYRLRDGILYTARLLNYGAVLKLGQEEVHISVARGK